MYRFLQFRNIELIEMITLIVFNNSKRLDYVLYSLKSIIQNVDYRMIMCDDSGKIENQNLTRQVIDKYSSSINIKKVNQINLMFRRFN